MKISFFVLNLIWILVQWFFSWREYGTFISYFANLSITIAIIILIFKMTKKTSYWFVILVIAQLIFLGLSTSYVYLPMVDSPNVILKVASVLIVLTTYFWFSKIEKTTKDV